MKRYLVLANLDQDRSWNMYSLRIDEVWHQFILFTRQYTEFFNRFFGYVRTTRATHRRWNSRGPSRRPPSSSSTRDT